MRPKLVLHICCAPDEAIVVDQLRESFDLHCFFCNPNIDTQEEFDLRLKESERIASLYNVPFSSDPYDPQLWKDEIKGAQDSPEGGERCRRCFLLRLRRTAAICKLLDFKTFTTVMSVSPHKRIQMLNETGAQAASEAGVNYEPFDFKKKDGFRKSIILSKELKIYRQDYCGCILSKMERDVRHHKSLDI